MENRGIRGYVVTFRQKRPAGGERRRREPLVEIVRQCIKRGVWCSRFRFRKQVVEPMFEQTARGFRQC